MISNQATLSIVTQEIFSYFVFIRDLTVCFVLIRDNQLIGNTIGQACHEMQSQPSCTHYFFFFFSKNKKEFPRDELYQV